MLDVVLRLKFRLGSFSCDMASLVGSCCDSNGDDGYSKRDIVKLPIA